MTTEAEQHLERVIAEEEAHANPCPDLLNHLYLLRNASAVEIEASLAALCGEAA